MSHQTARQAVVMAGATAPANSQQTPVQLILVNADGTAAGTVKKAAAQADSTATDVAGLKADFNALLAKLRTAGVIAP